MSHKRINGYHVMWLFVFFDLPVKTKTERRTAGIFRKKLLKDGFTMLQFSIYTRHCASKESAEMHIQRVKGFLTGKGKVSILSITDKQYSKMINFWGKNTVRKPPQPQQLELF